MVSCLVCLLNNFIGGNAVYLKNKDSTNEVNHKKNSVIIKIDSMNGPNSIK